MKPRTPHPPHPPPPPSCPPPLLSCPLTYEPEVSSCASQCIQICLLHLQSIALKIALLRTSLRQKLAGAAPTNPYPPHIHPHSPSPLYPPPTSPCLPGQPHIPSFPAQFLPTPGVKCSLWLHYSARFLNFSGIISLLFRRPFFNSSNCRAPLQALLENS